MKYDLITIINDSLREYDEDEKSIRQLDSNDVALIKMIQRQKFPELDGLNLYGIRGDDEETGELEIVLSSILINRLYLKIQHIENNSKLTLDDNKDTFHIELIGNRDKLSSFLLWYSYDEDIIWIKGNPMNGGLTMEVFINASGNISDVEDLHDESKHIEPDISVATEYVADPNGNRDYYHIYGMTNRLGVNDDYLLLKCREICNKHADQYFQTYENYMRPKR